MVHKHEQYFSSTVLLAPIQPEYVDDGNLTPLPNGYRYADNTGITSAEVTKLFLISGANPEAIEQVIVSCNEAYLYRGINIIYVGVRDESEKLIGLGTVFSNGAQGELADFAVHPLHRSKGVGRAIIDERLRRAQKKGIESLYIPPLKSTNNLRDYYLEKGFRVTETGEMIRGDIPVSITDQ